MFYDIINNLWWMCLLYSVLICIKLTTIKKLSLFRFFFNYNLNTHKKIFLLIIEFYQKLMFSIVTSTSTIDSIVNIFREHIKLKTLTSNKEILIKV